MSKHGNFKIISEIEYYAVIHILKRLDVELVFDYGKIWALNKEANLYLVEDCNKKYFIAEFVTCGTNN